MKRIAISGKYFQKCENVYYLKELKDKLVNENCTIFILENFYNITKEFFGDENITVIKKEDFEASDIDFVLAIGGDGTLLDTLSLVRNSGIPVAGINMGSLGFLSAITKDKISQSIDAILKGDYTIDSRTLLSLHTRTNYFNDFNYALNEICVVKTNSNSMLNIHVKVDGIDLASYWCDGLIVATPTGSTAYSLSCGGPIITPASPTFVITPIAPHNLTTRPIVISDDSEIEMSVSGRINDFLICLDSRTAEVTMPLTFSITKENFKINLINLSKSSFFSAIREKLGWGSDIRN